MKARVIEVSCTGFEASTYDPRPLKVSLDLNSGGYGCFLTQTMSIYSSRIGKSDRFERFMLIEDGKAKKCPEGNSDPVDCTCVFFPEQKFLRAHFSEPCVAIDVRKDGVHFGGNPGNKSLVSKSALQVMMPVGSGAEIYLHVVNGTPESGFTVEERFFSITDGGLPLIETRLERDARIVRSKLQEDEIAWSYDRQTRPLFRAARMRGCSLSASRTIATPPLEYTWPEFPDTVLTGEQLLAIVIGETTSAELHGGHFGSIGANSTGLGRSIGVVEVSDDVASHDEAGAVVLRNDRMWLELGTPGATSSVQWNPATYYSNRTGVLGEYSAGNAPAQFEPKPPGEIASMRMHTEERWLFLQSDRR